MKTFILSFYFLLCTISIFSQVSTTLNDFFMPGSQPNESGNFNSMPSNCGCHEGYDQSVEPMYNWQGSMMGTGDERSIIPGNSHHC
jgi:hypothetical protein